MNSQRVVIKNSLALYIMTFVRMAFPLITLPYLTRVLSYNGYGTVNYINAIMTYIRLIIDFGFLLSATAEISKYRDDKIQVGHIISNIIFARLILSFISLILLIILCCFIPILRDNLVFTFLSFLANILSIFLLDFFFQGIEEMQVLTFRFVMSQTISTGLTFVFVRSDNDLIWIPLLNIISTGIASLFSIYEVFGKYKIKLIPPSLKESFSKIKTAFIYWISDVSSTIFTALNTLLIGVYLATSDVALWSISLQIVIVIQRLYSPITNSIFPYMVREPRFNFIKKILIFFMPLVALGCAMLWVLAEWILLILGGEKYLAAVPILRALIPLTFISFPALLFGWPVLGAIGKAKETSVSTIVAASIQILCLLILGLTNNFNILNIAHIRAISELSLLGMRIIFTYENKNLFIDIIK